MTETAGWLEAHELPASRHLRTVGEILRREQAEAEAEAEAEPKRASPADTAGGTAEAAFMARVNGTPPRNMLAEAAAEPPGRDREDLDRRRAAIDLLRPHGLADVITGGQSGCIFDANIGIIEPAPDVAQQAALDAEYAFGRSERLAEEGRAIVRQARVRLREQWRSLALRERHRSAPTAHLESHSAAAGGPAPDWTADWERERQFRAAATGMSYR